MNLPFQAQQCFLANVVPPNGELQLAFILRSFYDQPCYNCLCAGEDEFDMAAMQFIQDEIRRGAVQAEIVGYDDHEQTPHVQLYILSGNQVRNVGLNQGGTLQVCYMFYNC